MLVLDKARIQYLAAVILPCLVAVPTWFLQGQINAANIALIYLLVVILVAVSTATKPTLLSVFVSLLVLNLIFTEPRGTLAVVHSQDVLTVLLFLLVAIIVGQLAAHIKENLELLKERETATTIELQLLQKLSSAITTVDIIEGLDEALEGLLGIDYSIISVVDGSLAPTTSRPDMPVELREKLEQFLNQEKSELSCSDSQDLVLRVDDGVQSHALIVLHRSNDLSQKNCRVLVQQTRLALIRVKLVNDLETEQIKRESEVMRSSMLASLSHDFKTPLTAMVGAATTLIELKEKLSQSQQEELLQSILDEARRLNSFTQNLLDMTRLGSGDLPVHRTSISIEELLHAVLKRIRQVYAHDIDTQLEHKIPLISAHTALLEQALFNIIDNACKFSDNNQPILIRCSSSGARLFFDVEDTGPGIPDAEKEKVLEMYHSADRGDRRVAGSGLGLAISRSMVGAHGGNIRIGDSETLGGCRVTVELPSGEDPE